VTHDLGWELPLAVRDHGEGKWERYARIFQAEVFPHLQRCRNYVRYLEGVVTEPEFGGFNHPNWKTFLEGKFLARLIGLVKQRSPHTPLATLEDLQATLAEQDDEA
jgi:hypothetical protein